MKIDSRAEIFILAVIVLCPITILALCLRYYTLYCGNDEFTANVSFIVVMAIGVALYIILYSFLLNLILPRLKKLLLHIPYFKKRHIREISIQETKVNEIVEPKEGRTDLNEIRQAQQQELRVILRERRLIAIHYTRSIFAHYALDSEIEYLCDCLDLYIERKGLANIRSVKISDKLATIDICHFGWNIWNHFRITNQDEIAEFLKVVFADALRNVDIKTVKSKLKEEGGKYIEINETMTLENV